jgi:hypothetical protein
MKHDKISEKAHVWTVTCGPDGRLRAELDEHLLRRWIRWPMLW